MKINGKIKSILDDVIGEDLYVSIQVKNYRHAEWLRELDRDVDYSIEIKKVKSQRSLNQNALLWRLLHELEKVTKELAMDWYIKALIETGAVVDYIWGMEKTESTLKKGFRAIQRVKPHTIKDSQGWLYRVIVGSSKFNIQEMNELIDTVLRYCTEHNIEKEMIE